MSRARTRQDTPANSFAYCSDKQRRVRVGMSPPLTLHATPFAYHSRRAYAHHVILDSSVPLVSFLHLLWFPVPRKLRFAPVHAAKHRLRSVVTWRKLLVPYSSLVPTSPTALFLLAHGLRARSDSFFSLVFPLRCITAQSRIEPMPASRAMALEQSNSVLGTPRSPVRLRRFLTECT